MDGNSTRQAVAMHRLVTGNHIYIHSSHNPADISQRRRIETAQHGQAPYAAILTCSDSRVPPEHIFSAGIGDLFVVRTAGNVVGDFEIGSIEYAVEHLHVPVLVIMGHTHCGAVAAALEGHAHGYIESVVYEIQLGLNGAITESEAVYNNVLHSKQRVLQSDTVARMMETGELMVICAIYDIETGYVHLIRGASK